MKITELQTGDVLLYKSTSWLSKAIRFFSKSKYSHASVVFDCWFNFFVAEADRKGVLVNSIENSIKGCEILVLRPKQSVNQSFNVYITRTLGNYEYGFFKLAVVQLVWQLSLHNIWLGKTKGEPKHFICGEYVEYMFHKYFFDQHFLNWRKATPQTLFESDFFTHYNLEKP
jgi:hypothetical protein